MVILCCCDICESANDNIQLKRQIVIIIVKHFLSLQQEFESFI